MTTATISAASSPQTDADLRQAVAEVFSVFQRCFRHLWRESFDDPKARPTWYAAIGRAGLSAADVRFGLGRAALNKRPPTCGEFIEICREDQPSLETALAEAVRWANGQVFEWAHPAIGAAARIVGAWAIKSGDERDIRVRFGAAYTRSIQRHGRGEPLDVPPMLALPRSVRTSIPPGASPPAVVAEIARAAAAAGVSLGSPPFRPSAPSTDPTEPRDTA